MYLLEPGGCPQISSGSHCYWSILFEILYSGEERDSLFLVKRDSCTCKGIWIGAPAQEHQTDREVCGIAHLGELETSMKLKGPLSEQRNTTDTPTAGKPRRDRESGQVALVETERMPRHSFSLHPCYLDMIGLQALPLESRAIISWGYFKSRYFYGCLHLFVNLKKVS